MRRRSYEYWHNVGNDVHKVWRRNERSNKSTTTQDSIFGTNNGLPNLLAANQSIFGTGQNAGQTDAIGQLLGFQAFGNNGAPGLNLAALTGLSSQKEEALIADASAGAVNSILNLKIPPLPDQAKTK